MRCPSLLLCVLLSACGDKDGEGGETGDGGTVGDGGTGSDGGTVGDGGSDGGTAGDGGSDGGTAGDGGTVECTDADADGDGWTDCQGDCADDDPEVLPGATSYERFTDGWWSTELPVAGGALLVTDLDGDRRDDLVLAVPDASAADLYLNDGTGSFTLAERHSAPVAPRALAAGDVDGDGAVDLAWANAEGDVVVHLGLGDGALDPTGLATATPCLEVGGLAAGDLDGDGLADLVLACETAGTAVLLSSGDGSFEVSLLAAFPSRELYLSDLDIDGSLDLLLGGGARQTSVLWGDGSGLLGDEHTDIDDLDRVAIDLADTDGDGDDDIVLSGSRGWAVAVAINDGARAFVVESATGLDAVGTEPFESFAAVDLDGDGDQDVAMVAGRYATLYFLEADHGALSLLGYRGTDGVPMVVEAADLDGDGADDLAWREGSTEDHLVAARQVDPATFGTALKIADDGLLGAASGDLDGDGDDDVVVATEGGLELWEAAAGELSLVDRAPGVGTFDGIVVADVDDDGHLDVLTWGRQSTTLPPLRVYWGDGSLAFGDQTDLAPDGVSFVGQVSWGDIDGDGVTDLVLADRLGAALLLFTGDGARSYGSGDRLALSDGTSADQNNQLVLADLDGDGDLDLAADEYGAGSLQVWENDGSGAYTLAWSTSSLRLDSLRALDLDEDGHIDLLVDTEAGGLVSLDGDGSVTGWGAARELLASQAQRSSLALADFTGEGRADLLLCESGTLAFARGEDGGTLAAAGSGGLLVSGSQCRDPQLADLDGDGQPEILAAVEGSGLAAWERSCP